MNSSTGMTVAIASPWARWLPVLGGAVQKVSPLFRAGNERVPHSGTPSAFRVAERPAFPAFPGPAGLPGVAGVLHVTGWPREPATLSQEKKPAPHAGGAGDPCGLMCTVVISFRLVSAEPEH